MTSDRSGHVKISQLINQVEYFTFQEAQKPEPPSYCSSSSSFKESTAKPRKRVSKPKLKLPTTHFTDQDEDLETLMDDVDENCISLPSTRAHHPPLNKLK